MTSVETADSESEFELSLPLPTERGAKVGYEITDDDRVQVVVPRVLTAAEARKAAITETGTLSHLIGVSAEVAEAMVNGAGKRVVEAAGDAARQIRSMFVGGRVVIDENGRLIREVLDERLLAAAEKARTKDKDPEIAGSNAFRSALRQAASIERAAMTYANARAQAVTLRAAMDAVKGGRTARQAARSQQRPMTEAERQAIERAGIGKVVKRGAGPPAPEPAETTADIIRKEGNGGHEDEEK